MSEPEPPIKPTQAGDDPAGPPQAARQSEPGKSVPSGPVKVLTILLVALGLAYACLWWSYQRFYGEFGVSPSDVGLAPGGNATDLAGSAVQLGIWLLLLITLMAALPLVALVAGEAWWNAHGKNRRLAAATLAATVTFLAFAGLLYWLIVDHITGIALLAGACIVFGIAVLLARVITISDTNTFVGITKAVPVTIPRLAVAISLTAAVVGVTFLDLPSDAADAGRCAATSPQSVPAINLPFPGVHLPVLAVHAQPARIGWLGSTPPANLPTAGNAVFLGQANGAVVIYDRSTHRAIRFPASDLSIAVDAQSPTCPGAH